MFAFYKDFLLHTLRAKTRHGVHSPFVYKLIDEVIYRHRPRLPPFTGKLKNGLLPETFVKMPVRIQQLIYRLINAFGPGNIIFLSFGNESGYDKFPDQIAGGSDETVAIAADIYATAGSKDAWKKIKAHAAVTLTVDLFWIGLIFFKSGRTKEHFKIRFW